VGETANSRYSRLNIRNILKAILTEFSLLFLNIRTIVAPMKLMLENLPPSLRGQADTLRRCLEAFDRVMPLQAVYLFGSHARGEARPTAMLTCA
jgi:hypothetical protein